MIEVDIFLNLMTLSHQSSVISDQLAVSSDVLSLSKGEQPAQTFRVSETLKVSESGEPVVAAAPAQGSTINLDIGTLPAGASVTIVEG